MGWAYNTSLGLRNWNLVRLQPTCLDPKNGRIQASLRLCYDDDPARSSDHQLVRTRAN